MRFPQFTPVIPVLRRDAFDHGHYIFGLKMDGFRALAYVEDQTRLVSRRGNFYRSFPSLCAAIHIDLDYEAVLDGEIVCADSEGRSQFYELLWRRGHADRPDVAQSDALPDARGLALASGRGRHRENSAAVKDLLVRLREQGLDTQRRYLFVIDGPKALPMCRRVYTAAWRPPT